MTHLAMTAAAALLASAGMQGPTSAAVAVAAAAQSSARAAAPAANPAQRICVQSDTTGSRIPRAICHTRAEWQRVGGLPTDDNR